MSNFQNARLPATWSLAQIDEIADINPKLDKSDLKDDLEVSFVPMPAVGAGDGRISVRERRKLSEVRKGYTAFIEGDVLFAKITPCMENGKMAVVPELRNNVGFGSTEFHVVRPLCGIVSKFIYYFISSEMFRREAEHNMTGAVGQRRVPTAYLAQHAIPLPPSHEQQRIVTKIEELFSELDKGVESLTTARAQIDLFRQATLQQAVSGLDGQTFPKLKLGNVIGKINQGWSPKCDLNRPPEDDEWAIIKTTAVQPMRHLSAECKPLPDDLEPREAIEIKDGDLLRVRPDNFDSISASWQSAGASAGSWP